MLSNSVFMMIIFNDGHKYLLRLSDIKSKMKYSLQ